MGDLDIGDLLAGEVYTEMATRFFDARRQIEEIIAVYHTYVDRLRAQAAGVDEQAGFFNHLFSQPSRITTFWQSLGVSDNDPLAARDWSRQALPQSLPFGWGPLQRYRKVVHWAYFRLRDVITDYLHGPEDAGGVTDEDDDEIRLSYHMLRQMCGLINTEIKKLNKERSASDVLHTAKKFQPEQLARERVSGATLPGDPERLNQRLAFVLIDFNALALPFYPELPAGSRATNGHISVLAAEEYRSNPAAVRRLLTELKTQIHRNRAW